MAARDKFLGIEQELNESYLERQEVVRGLLVALIAREHVVLLGPPGTAKSALAEDLCQRIGGTYFRWLVSRMSVPEELFGPVSLRALEQDSYRRVTTGKLPEATIAFVDEVFKCNSATLNTLLPILNERLFFNDGRPQPVPLEMAVAASNELPEDREELGALWDRFLLRYVVDYVRDPDSFERLLTGREQARRTGLTTEELKAAQAEAAAVDVASVIPRIAQVRQRMAELGVPISDRRWKQSLKVIRAHAWLEGRTEAQDDDLAILAHVLWDQPDQRLQVRQAIMAIANPYDEQAQDLLDQAVEAYQAAMGAPEDKQAAAGQEANKALKLVGRKLERLRDEARAAGRSTTRIEAALARVVAWNDEVIERCLKV